MDDHKTIKLSELKGISILYVDYLYDLAAFLLRLDVARSTRTTIRRHTLHGVAEIYSRVADIPAKLVHVRITDSGLPMKATIDED